MTINLRHKRLHQFESIDAVTWQIVPRLKTSGLSGNQWRQHVRMTFMFKGMVVREAGCRDMDAAAMLIGSEIIAYRDAGLSDQVIDHEKPLCDQPSCCNKATVSLILRRETAADGEWLEPTGDDVRYYRKFCSDHSERGNASREDCDKNYDRVPYPFPA